MGTDVKGAIGVIWKRIRLALAIAAVTYLGVIAAYMLFENSLVFHPASPAAWYTKPAGVLDVQFASDAGDTIHAWWFPGQPGRSAVLYSHGNAGNLSYRGVACQEWVRETGCSVLIYDYPGYGRSTGRPSEAGCYSAGRAALAWLLHEQRLSPERVILFGKSLGGGVAVELARGQPYRALVLARSFTSLPDIGAELFPWLPVRWMVRSQFDNLAKLRECRGPVFIHHGRSDTLIPPIHSERLFAAALEPKELVFDDGGHESAFTSEFWVRLRDFLSRHAPD